MAGTVLFCTDGSDHSIAAIRAGLALLGEVTDPVILTVVEPTDPFLVTGTGIAGGTISPTEFDTLNEAREADGRAVGELVAQAVGLPDARRLLLEGSSGPAICDAAVSEKAEAIVIGTRGRGGFKRAVLGSVSDHVVRNAPCPVVVTGERTPPA